MNHLKPLHPNKIVLFKGKPWSIHQKQFEVFKASGEPLEIIDKVEYWILKSIEINLKKAI